MHLTEHFERDVVGAVEIRTLEDKYDFRENGRVDRRDDIAKEIWGISAGLRRCDFERSKGAEVRQIKILK